MSYGNETIAQMLSKGGIKTWIVRFPNRPPINNML